MHPPLVGYGLDGVPIFGRYLYSASPGSALGLDDCGGHAHSGIGDPYIADGSYHYHSFVVNITTSVASVAPGGYAGTTTYTANANGPYMCWKGALLPPRSRPARPLGLALRERRSH